MDSNFWFYTLSTIPQTLAAIIALTATFVIFKLNHIESRTQKEYDEIKEWIMPLLPDIEIHEITRLNDSAMLQKLKEGINKLNPEESNLGFDGYDKLRDLYKNVIASHKRQFDPTEQRIHEYLLEKERILTSLLEVRNNALYRLKKSLFFTVPSIVGSIIFLPLYESLYGRVVSCSIVILLLLIVLTIVAVVYTSYSVWKIARPQLR